MQHRSEFPDLIDALGLKTAAEVGVAAGRFSQTLLRSRLERLYLIDNWFNPDEADLRTEALQLVDGQRVVAIEEASETAWERFADDELDFVYLDAMHDFAFVAAQLEQWWPKTGRVLAGHDYMLWNTAVGCPIGVIPAVEAFAERHGLTVHVTGARGTSAADRLAAAHAALGIEPGEWGDNFPSWWIFK